jgi:NitT/TauT family transport system substrate-binding protein
MKGEKGEVRTMANEPEYTVNKGRLVQLLFGFFVVVVGIGWFVQNHTSFNFNTIMEKVRGSGHTVGDATANAQAPTPQAATPIPAVHPNASQPANSYQAPIPGGIREVQQTHEKPVTVCVVDWPGYLGGQYFNGGFRASKQSRYYTEYGMLVEFVMTPSFADSRRMWQTDECDVLWGTADSFSTESGPLVAAGYSPRIIWQSDYSRGGDNATALPGVNSICDMRDRKIPVGAARGTPSETFLIFMARDCGIPPGGYDFRPQDQPEQVRDQLIAGTLKLGILWSPMEQDVKKQWKQARVVASTREHDHIIADIFFAKDSFAREHHDQLVYLVEGWMIGAKEINADSKGGPVRRAAAQINADGVGRGVEEVLDSIDNVYLSTFADNLAFFGMIRTSANPVTGQMIYEEAFRLYQAYDPEMASVPARPWSTIVDLSVLRDIQKRGRLNEAAVEPTPVYRPTPASVTAPAITNKRLYIRVLAHTRSPI